MLQSLVARRRSSVVSIRRNSNVVDFTTAIGGSRVTATDVVPFEARGAGTKLGKNRGRDVVTTAFARCFETGQLDQRRSVRYHDAPCVFRLTEWRTGSVFLNFQNERLEGRHLRQEARGFVLSLSALGAPTRCFCLALSEATHFIRSRWGHRVGCGHRFR
jgi:hypothetical protein